MALGELELALCCVMADRFVVGMYPVMIFCLGVGALCGVTFALLGVSMHVGWIEEIDFMESLGLTWTVGGGIGMVIGAFGGMIQFREQRDAAQERIDQL